MTQIVAQALSVKTFRGRRMDQGTQVWHDWRDNGLGSSDAPIVMGVSPWTTRFQLWQQKTKVKKKEFSGNAWAQDRGHQMEPKIRAEYEIRLGFIDLPPVLVEHSLFPFIRASLDGFNQKDGGIVLEIKAPGQADHEKAKSGIVPEKYFPQVQHQLLVTGAREAHYVSGWEDLKLPPAERKLDIAAVIVKPDRDYCARLLKEELLFWELVLTGRPPEKVAKDYRCVNRKEANAIAERYARLYDELKRVEQELLTHPLLDFENVRCKRVRIFKGPRAADPDHDRLSVLQNVDFDQFRRPALAAPEVLVMPENEGENDDEP